MKWRIFLGILVLVVGYLAFRWWFAEPTITVNFQDAPLSKVLAAFERQGKIKLTTTLDLNTPVTLQVRRSPVIDAVDLLAVRLDGGWRVAWVLGPTPSSLNEGLTAVGRRDVEGWRSFYFPAFGMDFGTVLPDPRAINWKVEPAGNGTLSEYLDQGSQKLPVEFLIPDDWNPSIARVPSSGNAAEVTRQLLTAAKGQGREVFVLTGGGGWGGGFGGGERRGRREDPGSPLPERNPGSANPGSPANRPPAFANDRNETWLMERAQSMAQALPPEQRQESLAFLEEIRQLREKTRDLPEDERRAVWEEFMQRPEVQERREEAMAARDAKRTPEQREARYRRIAERRLEARTEAGNPIKARP